MRLAYFGISLILAAVAVRSCSQDEVFPTRLQSFEYPILGTQARLAGDVKVTVTLADDGTVLSVTRISGNSVLAEAAQRAIKEWRFARRCPTAGTAPKSIVLDIEFRLSGVTQRRPTSVLTYTHPNRITVVSQAAHFQPAKP